MYRNKNTNTEKLITDIETNTEKWKTDIETNTENNNTDKETINKLTAFKKHRHGSLCTYELWNVWGRGGNGKAAILKRYKSMIGGWVGAALPFVLIRISKPPFILVVILWSIFTSLLSIWTTKIGL
jgi:hypothetical protein